MAHIHRLIFAFLILCAGVAHAAFPSSGNVYAFPSTGYGPSGPYLSTVQAACDWGKTAYLNAAGYSGAVTSVGIQCQYRFASGSLGPTYNVLTAAYCPANASASGSTCSCNTAYQQSGSTSAATCVSNVDAAKQTCDLLNSAGVPLTASVGSTGLNSCFNGFVVRATGAAYGIKSGVTTPGSFFGPFSCSGATCSGVVSGGSAGDTTTAPQGTQEPGAADCKPTEYWGTVNGVSTCVKSSNTTSGGPSTTAPTPAGSASAPTSGLGTNAPPSATGSSQQTTCQTGSCSTTTTYTNGSGGVVGTTTDTKPQLTFCKENPGASMCLQSSVAGTACGASDACSGDAIQCAIEAQAKITACAFKNDAAVTAQETAFANALGKTGDQTTGPTVNTTVAISASSFDQSDAIGGAAGLSDLTVMVRGAPFTLPLSGLNYWFSMLGYVLVAVTAMVCAKIVARG